MEGGSRWKGFKMSMLRVMEDLGFKVLQTKRVKKDHRVGTSRPGGVGGWKGVPAMENLRSDGTGTNECPCPTYDRSRTTSFIP